ncbi:hypothetical protein AB0A94_03780 [Streptomyces sp. NPDC044984]
MRTLEPRADLSRPVLAWPVPATSRVVSVPSAERFRGAVTIGRPHLHPRP